MSRALPLALLSAFLALPTPLAVAQPGEAWVVTTLTDPATGLPIGGVAPGATVRVRTTVSWQPMSQMAGLSGDMLCLPITGAGVGVPSNKYSEFFPGSLVNLGAFVGDDVLGIAIGVTPMFFTPWVLPPSGNYTGIQFIGYDWTAPNSPGEYHFIFRTDPNWPDFRHYPSVTSPAFAILPTAYIGATITVIPAAPTLATLALAAPVRLPRRPRARHESRSRDRAIRAVAYTGSVRSPRCRTPPPRGLMQLLSEPRT